MKKVIYVFQSIPYPSVYKLGCTTSVDRVESRLKAFNDTAKIDPDKRTGSQNEYARHAPYRLIRVYITEDAQAIEALIHADQIEHRITSPGWEPDGHYRREWSTELFKLNSVSVIDSYERGGAMEKVDHKALESEERATWIDNIEARKIGGGELFMDRVWDAHTKMFGTTPLLWGDNCKKTFLEKADLVMEAILNESPYRDPRPPGFKDMWA